jgi:branched-chain amino acid transport system permease protein
MNTFLRKNLVLFILLAIFTGLFAAAAQGMKTQDFVITLLRSLSVGSLTFLVASGFSLIFGLLDVLNLAHGTLFMVGAYIGWTVYVRPDTFVDLLTPLALILSGFLIGDVWTALSTQNLLPSRMRRIIPWGGILASALPSPI